MSKWILGENVKLLDKTTVPVSHDIKNDGPVWNGEEIIIYGGWWYYERNPTYACPFCHGTGEW
jgi:hypothetical protein